MVFLAAVLVAGSASIVQAPQRPPEFPAGVRLIRLDVSVVDKRGQPVPGLLPEHFEVKEDGRPSEAETSGRFLSPFAQGAGLLGTLEALITELEGVPGRKALVLISPGFPQIRGLDRRLERVATLARGAATAIYYVDAAGQDGLLPEAGQRLRPAFEAAWARSGGAQDLAEATGGFTSRFDNSLLRALTRASAEMRTYYVLGYAPPRADARFRRVSVKVKIPGLSARTKKGYLAPR